MSADLLSPVLVARLDRLRLQARRPVRGAAGGAHRSVRRGASPEIAEHRPYHPGDDPRRIDWNAYARLGELVVRLPVAEDELTLHLVADTSGSLGFGAPPKLDVARRALAALGYVALSNGERVAVGAFAGGPEAGAADASRRTLPPGRGRRRVGPLLGFLGELAPSGRTSLVRAVDAFLAARPRPGIVALASDLLDPDGWQRPLDRLLAERHTLWLLHVLSDDDWSPPPGEQVRLVDGETGEVLALDLDDEARAAYAWARDDWLGSVDAWARRRGVRVLRLVGAAPLDDPLVRFLRGAP